MKKAICLLLTLLMAIGICACTAKNAPDAGSNGSAPSEGNASVVSDASSETGASLEKLQAEIEELKKQNTSLQADLDALQEQGFAFKDAAEVCTDIFSIDYFHRFVTMENRHAEDHLYYELYYMDDDLEGAKLVLRNDRRFWNVSASPSGKKVLFNDFEIEGGGGLYLYDIEAEALSEINFEGMLKEDHYAHYVDWLDDRYFLLTEGTDYPNVYGGNIYVYDTQTKTCRELIKTENSGMEIRSFSVYNRNESWQEEQEKSILFEIVIFEDANFKEMRYAMLPVSKILNAIEKQSTVTLKAKETF